MNQYKIDYEIIGVKDVIQILRNYENKTIKARSRLGKSGWILLAIAIICSALAFLPLIAPRLVLMFGLNIQTWIYLLPLIGYLFAYSLFFMGVIPAIRAILRPVDRLLSGLQESLHDKTELIEKLSRAYPLDLDQVIILIEHGIDRMEKHLSKLSNNLQKTGIISILVVIYITYEKKDIVWSTPAYILLVLVLSYFIGACLRTFRLQYIIERSGLLLLIVKAAKDKSLSGKVYEYL